MTRRLRIDIRQASRGLLLAWAVLALANVLFYLLLTRPKVLEHREMEDGATGMQRAIARDEARVEDLDRYVAALEKARDDLQRLRHDILATRNRRQVDVEVEVAKLAESFGINLDQVTYEHEALPDEGLHRMAMVVPLEGGYENLRSFIRAVEASEQFLVVERVALGTGRQGGVMLQLNITLATYFDAPEYLRPGREPQPPARPPRT